MAKNVSYLKDMYTKFTEDDLWLIKEIEWERSIQGIREVQFALGNGYIGSRAILEEVPIDAKPGTYIAGIYDKLASQVSELVNFPNPFNFKFAVDGEKIGVTAMDVIRHRRALNMKKGLLLRDTLYKNSKGQRFDYQSLRLVSMSKKNFGMMQVVLTPLDADCTIDVQTGMDTSVYNAGTLTEGDKKHFRIKELGQKSNAGYLVTETFEKKHTLVYWSGFYYEYRGKKIYAKDNVFKIKVKKDESIVFTKIFSIEDFKVSKSHKKHKEDSFKRFYRVFHSKFSSLLDAHIKEWDKLWDVSDVQIKGTANLQINMRLNIYHMLICAHVDDGFSSIGARTLSGEGYRGHIFWDAEIFLLPFYLYTNPEVAKNMLEYRYKRLDQAREIAKSFGYKGAMFPWESGESGFDETPTWAKDINGEIVKIFTNHMEQHITPDIAYATYKYYTSTDDEKFMKDCGYEMLFETARFCADRLEHNKSKDIYEITGVIGPDEFHVDVKNNAYTNMMVKWNLLMAYEMAKQFKEKHPKAYESLTKRMKLKKEEMKKWKSKAEKIKKMNINKNGVIEQFDGYFKLKDATFEEMDENGIPVLPEKLGTTDMEKTQLLKQGDITVMLYLLPELFTQDTVRINHLHYISRTAHKSSLSPSVSSIVACRAGDIYRAYNLFNVSLRADATNLYGNTAEGAHAASLGGTYQALIFGFAGLSVSSEGLSISPSMPRTWASLTFSFAWKGRILKFEISRNMVKVRIKSGVKGELKIKVFGEERTLKGSKNYIFEGDKKQTATEFYY